MIVRPGDELRPAVEDHVRSVFARAYGATLRGFPELMVADLDTDAAVRCAAGLRMARNGFFSEHYFDSPLEKIIAGLDRRAVDRARVVEVAGLAAGSRANPSRFIRDIIRCAADAGAEWAVFTITPRLHSLLERLGHDIAVLGPADPARIPNADDWGSYYDTRPVVAAMRKPAGLYAEERSRTSLVPARFRRSGAPDFAACLLNA